ncbi:MAG: hypothetical protein R2692_09445 [Microbacterium sp.]
MSSSASRSRGHREPAADPARRRADRKPDPATSIDIMQLLARINEGGTIVVMATHEAGSVDQMVPTGHRA